MAVIGAPGSCWLLGCHRVLGQSCGDRSAGNAAGACKRSRAVWPLLVVERSWLHHGRVALSEQFDAVLVAAQGGAPWAVEAIYRALHPSVLGVLRHRAPNDAEGLSGPYSTGRSGAWPGRCQMAR